MTYPEFQYIESSSNTIFFSRYGSSLVFSMPAPYDKIYSDDRSWDEMWVKHFGRRGSHRYEFKFLGVMAADQPTNLRWYIDSNSELSSVDIERTIEYNKNRLHQHISNLFKIK
jgi:hypothetical protein